MLDDALKPREQQPEPGGKKAADGAASRPIADREVPLPTPGMPSPLHAWLDGDLPESAVRADLARDVEFWNRINKETERRRQMRTPPHVVEQIMQSIPQSVPVAAPWWRRSLSVTPVTFVMLSVGAFTLGMALGVLILRLR